MPDQILKTIASGICPHCSNEFMISFRTMNPSIDWTLKPESVKAVKTNLIAKIEKLEFNNEDDRKEALRWLQDDNVAFGPEESDRIMEQIKKDYGKK